MRQISSKPLQPTPRTRLQAFVFERGGLLALAVLAVYFWLAPTTIVDGDNAEFSALGALGGRAHPSGYPAYVLYLRLTSWLPGASAAHTAAIATCVLAALAVLVLHAACRAWGARPLAATFACALYATAPVVLRMHSEAEVFAGNALVVATILWLAARAGPVRGVARAALLGLVAGLGLANHLTCALVAPVGLLGVARAIGEAPRKPLAGLAALAGLVVGLAPYAYLFVADGPTSFGQVESVADLVAFITREDYGGPAAFVPGGVEVSAATNLGSLVESLGRAWLWLPGAFGLAMLGWRAARRHELGETRLAWMMLAASFIIAGPVLVTRFNIEPSGIGLYVNQRFYLLPMLLLAIPVASAFDRLGERIAQHTPRLRSTALGTAIALVMIGALVVVALPRLRAIHSPAMARGVHHLLQSLPPGAVVLVDAEDICFGAAYLQHVEGERRDADVMCWILTSRDWFRRRVLARGIPLLPFTEHPAPTQLEAIIAAGRPVFVNRGMMAVRAVMPNYAHGVLVRVLPRGAAVPGIGEVAELNRTLYAAMDLEYARPGLDDDYATLAHKRYAATWVAIGKELRAAGNEEGARAAIALARTLYDIGNIE
jgi:hypothetical protein